MADEPALKKDDRGGPGPPNGKWQRLPLPAGKGRGEALQFQTREGKGGPMGGRGGIEPDATKGQKKTATLF